MENRDPFSPRSCGQEPRRENVAGTCQDEQCRVAERPCGDVRLHDRPLDRTDALRRPSSRPRRRSRCRNFRRVIPTRPASWRSALILTSANGVRTTGGLCGRGGAAKVVAAGAPFETDAILLSGVFRADDRRPESWGKPPAALLGALKMQEELGLASIGGKDSMSGTFERDDRRTADAHRVRHHDGRCWQGDLPELKWRGNRIYLVKHTPLAQDARHGAAEEELESYSAGR